MHRGVGGWINAEQEEDGKTHGREGWRNTQQGERRSAQQGVGDTETNRGGGGTKKPTAGG